MSTKTISAFDLDIRVRERNIKSGTLSEKDLEKFLGGLPDLADAAEPVSLAQPALAAEDDDGADDLDDEEDEEDDEPEAVAAPVAVAAPPAPAAEPAPAPAAEATEEPSAS